MTTMVTSLKSISFGHLEFKDETQLLFMGRDNSQLFSFLKSFKGDIEYRVQKAVKLRCFQESSYIGYQVNMITQKLTTLAQLEEEKQVEDNFAQRGLFRGPMKKLPNLLASTKQNMPLGEFFAVLEDINLKVFEKTTFSTLDVINLTQVPFNLKTTEDGRNVIAFEQGRGVYQVEDAGEFGQWCEALKAIKK